ncbi:MAG: serine/threonine protein kinase [Planctomycetota bacterium]
MIKKLPGSSDASALEIFRLQRQCDRVRAENQLHSIDQQDEEAICQRVLRIPSPHAIESSDGAHNDRFSEVALVGVGAFGLVFSCVDADQGGREVAVKMLRPSRQNDRVARERFLEEIRVMSGFNHPGIVRVFGTGEIDQLPYMIAEFADAGSLASLIHETTDLITPRQAAWLVSRIAEAVGEAHSTAILHRDIKPGNILLRRESPEKSEGLGLWPLLTDFGLSKNLSPQTNMLLTIDGEVLGTLSYMSPEQVRGQSLKTQSDLFSLGVILHELVYTRHPFLEDNDFQTRNNIVQSPPFKPLGYTHRIPAPLDAIISKCLQKNPEDRYPHASDLAKDLKHFLNGEPISVAAPTVWQLILLWTNRHPIATTFLATVLCCVIAGVLLLSREWRIQWELAKDSRALADDRAKISQLFLESMRVTNNGINDTILAGKRVLPTELLQTLDRQIPLLEDARALSPDDDMLSRQLQIMCHYKSLCHNIATGLPEQFSTQEQFANAIGARKKSLGYIENLLSRFPDDESLMIAKINGEYLMSTLVRNQGDPAQGQEWNAKTLESAESFLKKHPRHLYVTETANVARLERSLLTADETPEESIGVLEEVINGNLQLFSENPSRTSLFINSVYALILRSNLLLRNDRDQEASEDFSRIESLFVDHRGLLQDDWQGTEWLWKCYMYRCQALFEKGRFAETEVTAVRWLSRLETLRTPSYMVIQQYRFDGREFITLFPIYCRWLALSKIDSESDSFAEAEQELIAALSECRAVSDSGLDNFVRAAETSGQPVDRLKVLLEQVRAVAPRSQVEPETEGTSKNTDSESP